METEKKNAKLLEVVGGTAYNNLEKIKARNLIINFINQNLLIEDKKILELWGNGVGAKHMLAVLPKVTHIHLIEKVKHLQDHMYNNLPKRTGVRIKPIMSSLNEHFDESIFVYNIINLDFCSAYLCTSNPNSPGRIVEQCFENRCLCVTRGILLVNIQVAGSSAAFNRGAVVDVEKIINDVLHKAITHGYDLEETLNYSYLSGKGTRMQLLGFSKKQERK